MRALLLLFPGLLHMNLNMQLTGLTAIRVASGDDIRPNFRLEFDEVTKIDQCDMFLHSLLWGMPGYLKSRLMAAIGKSVKYRTKLLPLTTHRYRSGEAKFLRVRIIKGDPGLWEIKVY